MTSIAPFTIHVPQPQLDNLRERLANTIWPSVIDGHDYGGPPIVGMKALAERMQKFDWRKKEAELNRLPHFTTDIDSQNVHFIHVRSSRTDAVPLMLIHGWPGSFVEFLGVIAPLTNPAEGEQAFHVIVPSVPGFAFSGPTSSTGWNHDRIAHALLELMTQLGYDRFAIQGGDAGALLGPDMARLAPKRIIAVHVNAATLGFMPMGAVDEAEMATFTPAELERLQRLQDFMQVKFGFNLLQSNQPQLAAYALSDSPVGCMAWMTQLFAPEGLEEQFLTNFVIYWTTGTIASSIRMYYEGAHDPAAWAPKANSGVPTGVAVFQDEDIAIRRYAEEANTIVRWTEYPAGGHYAVMRAPDIWLRDVREFFQDVAR